MATRTWFNARLIWIAPLVLAGGLACSGESFSGEFGSTGSGGAGTDSGSSGAAGASGSSSTTGDGGASSSSVTTSTTTGTGSGTGGTGGSGGSAGAGSGSGGTGGKAGAGGAGGKSGAGGAAGTGGRGQQDASVDAREAGSGGGTVDAGGDMICPPCVYIIAPPPPGCKPSGPCGCGPYVCPDAGGDGGVRCGDNVCAPGLVCCNALRGICTVPGGVCIQ